MPIRHRVKQGDCLLSIAAANGCADFTRIWRAPENGALRQRRQDPRVLAEGDEV